MQLTGAIDLGGTKTLTGIIDEQGRILASRRRITPHDDPDPVPFFRACMGDLDTLCSDLGILPEGLSGLGMTVPGMADAEKGILLEAVFSGWKNVPVAEIMASLSGIKTVRIDNDVNACAVGEMTFGYGKRYRDFLWMTVSTGVGGAVVADGKLIRGSRGCSGEIGHVKVEYEHPYRCPCGGMGCLEAHGSGTAITRMTREAAEKDPKFAKRLAEASLAQDAAGCAELARTGDPTAAGIYANAGDYLGRGISAYANLANPDAVIIGGGVSRSLDLLLPAIRASVDRNTVHNILGFDIVPTKLGYEAALIGAAALVNV